MVLNNLDLVDAEAALQEMVRVISVGGEARVAYHDSDFLNELVRRLREISWLSVSVDLFKTSWEYSDPTPIGRSKQAAPRLLSADVRLLIITKLATAPRRKSGI